MQIYQFALKQIIELFKNKKHKISVITLKLINWNDFNIFEDYL